MAYVASDLKSQMLSRMLPQAGKQTYASDRQATTPFDSLLDETTPPAPEPQQTRAADDNTPRSDRAERSKPADKPDRPAASDDANPPSGAAAAKDTAAPSADDQTSGDATADKAAKTAKSGKADAKTDETTAAINAKPADAADAVAVAVVIDPTLAAATVKGGAKADIKADAAGTTAAANVGTAPNSATEEADADATLADASPQALAALAGQADKTGKADKSEKKADDKSAISAKAAGKTQTSIHPDAATQAATTGEPRKDSDAHAGAEETTDSHRGVATPKTAAAAAPDTAATAAPRVADLTPPPALTTATPTHAAPATAAVAVTSTAPTGAADAAVPLAGVAFEITSKVQSGKNQFDIRLDPADLGRIHVRMDVDRDGNVVTHMTADRPDTLDMLRKDTAGLERALQDAGLKTSDNSLQFSLRDQSANQQQQSNNGSNTANIVVEDEQLTANETTQRNYAAYRGQASGLDIRV